MTDEEIRIKIAEACGLTNFKPLRYATRNGRLLEPGEKGVRLMYCGGGTNGWQDWEDVPNYPKDLNAIVEAARNLPDDGTRLRFVEELASLQTDHHPFFSTAREWCLAFVRTVTT